MTFEGSEPCGTKTTVQRRLDIQLTFISVGASDTVSNRPDKVANSGPSRGDLSHEPRAKVALGTFHVKSAKSRITL